jgi:hypothetical protein
MPQARLSCSCSRTTLTKPANASPARRDWPPNASVQLPPSNAGCVLSRSAGRSRRRSSMARADTGEPIASGLEQTYISQSCLAQSYLTLCRNLPLTKLEQNLSKNLLHYVRYLLARATFWIFAKRWATSSKAIWSKPSFRAGGRNGPRSTPMPGGCSTGPCGAAPTPAWRLRRWRFVAGPASSLSGWKADNRGRDHANRDPIISRTMRAS